MRHWENMIKSDFAAIIWGLLQEPPTNSHGIPQSYWISIGKISQLILSKSTNWLVVYLPLSKIGKSIGMIIKNHSQYTEK